MKKSVVLIIALFGLTLVSCSQKKDDPMKECMKSLTHMQCVKKLSK